MNNLKIVLAMLLIGTVLVGCTKNESTQFSNASLETINETNTREITDNTESTQTLRNSTSKEDASEDATNVNDGVVPADLDGEAILRGDYTSLDGSWTNSNGNQLSIKGGKITLPKNGFDGVTQFSLNKPQKNNNVIYLSFDPAPSPNGMNLLIVLKGNSPSDEIKDGTDSSEDRFIMGNNGGTTLFQSRENGGISDTAYYRRD